MVSETLMAYEFGIQARPFDRFSLSLATFYNEYDELRNRALAGFTPGVPPTFNASLENGLTGESYGVELGPVWQLADWWRLQASYTWYKLNLHVMPGHTSVQSLMIEGASPQHQFSVRSALDLPGNVQFDAGVRYVDQLAALGVPSYIAMDLRLAWQATKQLEFSIVGQNLLDRGHPEYVSSFLTATPTEVQHSVYGQISWRF
jgi:iron complex outermembrane receptor protein